MELLYCMVILIVSINTQAIGAPTNCDVQFIEQPPRELSCDPYGHKIEQLFFRLGCGIEPNIDIQSVSLKFQLEFNDTVEDVPCTIVPVSNAGTHRCLLDIGFETRTPLMYWCTGSYTTTDGEIVTLGRSTITNVYGKETYTGATRCDNTNSVDEISCADAVPGISTTTTATTVMATSTVAASRSIPASTKSLPPTNLLSTQSVINPSTSSSEYTSSSSSSMGDTHSIEINIEGIQQSQKPIETTANFESMQESISVVSKLSTAEPELTTSLTKATPTATNFQTAQKSSSNSISISVLQGNIEPTTTAPPTNYNIFNSEIMIMSLLVIIAILLLALVVTLILMVVIVVVFKRRVRCAESRKTDTRAKPDDCSNHESEGCSGVPKYVYPSAVELEVSNGIYTIPNREDALRSSKNSTDSGRGTSRQESYQSLMSNNMEYTSIYSIPTTSSIKGDPKVKAGKIENTAVAVVL